MVDDKLHDFDKVLEAPQSNDYRNVIYDNLSNINDYGFDGKYGSQIAILTFLDEKGNITQNDIENKTFNMILREPFKVTLSTKQPTESPYVTLVREMQQKNIKRCAYSTILNSDENNDTLYTPINLTDNYAYRMYSGTENPTFNLCGRIYTDRTIFRPLHKDSNGKDVSNLYYIIDFLSNILSCILPNYYDKNSEKDLINNILTKLGAAFEGGILKQVQKSFTFITGLTAAGVVAKEGVKEFSKKIDNNVEGTYGTKVVSFAIPWLFGNLGTFGSINKNNVQDVESNGTSKYINIGSMLEAKCFIKHFDFKLSKEYYVEKVVKNSGEDSGENAEEINHRYPAYIDINLTLESVNIPSVKSWMSNWLQNVNL